MRVNIVLLSEISGKIYKKSGGMDKEDIKSRFKEKNFVKIFIAG